MELLKGSTRIFFESGKYYIENENSRLQLFENTKAAMMFLTFLEMEFTDFSARLQEQFEAPMKSIIDIDFLLHFIVDGGSQYWIEKLLTWILEGKLKLSAASMELIASLVNNRKMAQHIRHLAQKISTSHS